MDERLRAELVALAEEDREVRSRLAADGSLFGGYHPEMEAVHARNAARLREILDEHGAWPGPRVAGEDGAEAAWLIVQHAITDPPLQRRCLGLLEAAEDVDPVRIAMLDDRIRSFEGRPQRYGTQFDWDADGQLNPFPIDDEAEVDRRRSQLGLPPLSQAVAAMRASLGHEPPPADPARRVAEREAWARRNGWRNPGPEE